MAGPTYTYYPNTPESANPMKVTQPLILSNFQAINELIGVNHGAFNTMNAGKHNIISLPFPSTATTPIDTDINIFAAITGSPNPAEIFYQNSTSGPTQLSAVQPGGGTPAGTSGTGWCKFTTSGIIMKWGTGTVSTTGTLYPGNVYPGGTAATFTLPTGSSIPAYTFQIGYAKISPTSIPDSSFNYGNVACSFGNGAKTSFKIYATIPSTISFNWFTIGL